MNTALQDMVLDSVNVHEFLETLAKFAAAKFSTEDDEVLVGITLLRPRRAATVASSGEQAQKMDEVQYKFDDGPCLRAARTEKTIYVPDFHQETRFPGYQSAIADHGVRSALGVPIRLEGEANAGLDLYSARVDAFNDEAIEAAEAFAHEAAMSLRMAVRIAQLTETSEHLRTAMETRTVIDLAAGIIMGQNHCTQDEAVRILKMASSARNTKLSVVAEALVEGVNKTPPSTHFDN